MLSDLKSILSLLTTRERWKLALLFVLMLIAALLEAVGVGAVPLFVAFLMEPSKLSDHAILSKWLPELPSVVTTDLVIWGSLILFSFILFKSCFLAAVYYIQSRVVSLQYARLSNRMFRTYQKAPYDWIMQRGSSDLMRNIQNDTHQVINGVLMATLDLTLAVILSLSVVTVMVLATPSSTIISMSIVGLGLYTVIRLMRTRMRNAGMIQRAEFERSIQSIQQGFGAIVDARIIGCENYLSAIHRQSVLNSARADVVTFTLNKITPTVIEAVAVLGLLTVVFFIIRSGETIQSSLPVLSVIGVALIRLKQMAAKIANGANAINRSRPYIPGLLKDIRELDELELAQQDKVDRGQSISDFESLQIESISYCYPKSERPAVRKISLELRKGESIAFVGATGCGKSTMVNLILGLLQPQTGRILANEIDIQAAPNGWRNCLGYIPQSIFLIDDTLRANIAFGVPHDQVDPERLQSALTSAALATFIDELPDGLDTVIGERGVRLSGGQRQRLGIARALYFNPQVLVMDEATSALDNQTEAEVMQAIQNLKKERTLIMIAHRLSTVEDCDRLYFLEAGQIADAGNYQQLIETSPAFRSMAAVAD